MCISSFTILPALLWGQVQYEMSLTEFSNRFWIMWGISACLIILGLLLIWDFDSCEHKWRYIGSGIREALLPEWIFKCVHCANKEWPLEGIFLDKQSCDHYRELMKSEFKQEWNLY